ncbi:MAG: glycosyltransferase family 2 protein, partial [Sulfuricaulis sp.]|uniref:glycosyltransferase n=1 Tax=Sulfuricaulis sp. TaxID=2003553 RepID=UPI003C55F7B2
MTELSVIISTQDRSAIVRRALQSIVDQDFPRERYEVLVIDNVSTDDTRSVVNEDIERIGSRCNVRYVYEAIPGATPARHRGATEAHGAILVYIDDDIVADRGFLASISDAFSDPSVHLVGGKNLPNYAAPPPAWVDQLWQRGPDYAFCIDYSLSDHGDRRREIDPDHVWTLNFSIRRDTLMRLGGFHPDLVPRRYQRYQGDGETGLTMKLKEQGLKAIYEPGALVHHLVAAERLNMEYLEKRRFFQGVCASYTSIRKTRKTGYMIAPPSLYPLTQQEILAY